MINENEDSSESENEEVSAHRSTRNWQSTERFKHWDLDTDEESDWEVSEVFFVYSMI